MKPIISYILSFVGIQLLMSFLVSCVGNLAKLPQSTVLTFALLLSDVGLILFFLFVKHRETTPVMPFIKLRKEPTLAFFAILMLLVAQLFASFTFDFFNMQDESAAVFKSILGSALGFIVVSVLGPITEELFFRRLLLLSILKLKPEYPWLAIAGSSLIFGLLHGFMVQSIAACFIGLILGWLYYRTRHLGLVILMHIVNNLLASIEFLVFPSLQHRFNGMENLNTVYLCYGLSIVAFSMLAITVSKLLYRIDQRHIKMQKM